MKKIVLAVLVGLTVAGCANQDIYSGSVYSSGQAKEARSISYGTIVSTRPVKIQADNQGVIGTIGGGAIGGIAGSAIGGGTGRALATAVGAIAGAVTGSKVEEKVSQVSALEMVIKKDDGKEIVVVQKAEPNLVPGARVRIVGGSRLNVSAL
ncbi:outer membrane lipoprotein pcp [Aggregatibacter actinomycetemcomitans serotype e str. SC1083]|uniref:Outer membrane lipoprotein pcp n=1 Tax=Aggregatibacter actinomycetemcomitans serotype e str. SC1083 TaxID=907488 RepID=G4A5X1_AGGAC|nr:glycine zipper 2TM domain-containing protein [Aggregatibacter actinomycetemcomitans]EGY35206.1 outer membrane lipoprotein pcp [Aggregatibacter actinomycetemcomitans serotype e str. SC1083]KYK82797.1 membrane protein [Aggregatibacter actinomycetemcomitans serotype e str. SC936]